MEKFSFSCSEQIVVNFKVKEWQNCPKSVSPPSSHLWMSGQHWAMCLDLLEWHSLPWKFQNQVGRGDGALRAQEMGLLGLMSGTQVWGNATKNFSTLWWKEGHFWIGWFNERQTQFRKNKIWLLNTKVIFIAEDQPSNKMLQLLKFGSEGNFTGTLESVLLIMEITYCDCLKGFSESLAKVTQSLPMEVVSPKGWGLFPERLTVPFVIVTSCFPST